MNVVIIMKLSKSSQFRSNFAHQTGRPSQPESEEESDTETTGNGCFMMSCHGNRSQANGGAG